MNIVTFLFYAALACLFLGVGLPYLELVAGVCALILAVKSI